VKEVYVTFSERAMLVWHLSKTFPHLCTCKVSWTSPCYDVRNKMQYGWEYREICRAKLCGRLGLHIEKKYER